MINNPGNERNAHPLSHDENTVKVVLLDELRRRDPQGTLRNLIFEDTWAARGVLEGFRRSRPTGEADAVLLQSILATVELHRLGTLYDREGKNRPLSQEESALWDVAGRAYKTDMVNKLILAYGLSDYEHRAIQAYSDASKSEEFVLEQSNPTYMGPSEANWGTYGDGWSALESALAKLPSLQRLGLEITTYRAARTRTESEALNELEPESNVKHGIHVMQMGQKHYTSTAITYNGHWTRFGKVGCVIALTGYSGVLINPFGKMGIIDGAEILYPPEIVTRYEGQNPAGYQDKEVTVPVFHLKEVAFPETDQKVVEDKDFAILRARGSDLEKRKLELIRAMESIVYKHGLDELERARRESGVKGPLMYLTLDELRTLFFYL